jgi:hypothetical protein
VEDDEEQHSLAHTGLILTGIGILALTFWLAVATHVLPLPF